MSLRFASVRLQMTIKVVHPVEPSFTCAAPIRLLSRMHHLVPIEVAGLIETLAANLAFKRLFARVDPQMRFQGGGLRETFAANMARKGPIARVNTKMIL